MESHATVKIARMLAQDTNAKASMQSFSLVDLDFGVPPPIQRLSELPDITAYQDELGQTPDPYRPWYDLIEEDTHRNPAFTGDKLAAFLPHAKEFSSSVPTDTYAAGIWRGDLITGLLWHSSDFESTELTPIGEPLKLPASHPRAPSWSWTALDGSIRFLRKHTLDLSDKIPPLIRDIHAYTIPTSAMDRIFYSGPTPDADRFGSVSIRNGAISLHGQFRPFNGLRGFSAPFATWMRDNRPLLGYDCVPDIAVDPDFVFDCDKYVLPLARKKCHPRCRHSTGCDKDPMAYGLILHFVGQGPTYDNLPALRLARAESEGIVRMNVDVFMRCGMAVFYTSDFEEEAWQDGVIV